MPKRNRENTRPRDLVGELPPAKDPTDDPAFKAGFVEAAVEQGLLHGVTPRQADLARITSVRAYRRVIERALLSAILGRLSAGQLRGIVEAAKEGASLLMTEKILAAKGLMDDEPTHPAGADGGLLIPIDLPTEPRKVTVERTTGVGTTGDMVDTTTVTIEGGNDLAAEVPAVSGGAMHVPEALPTTPDNGEAAALSMSARLVGKQPIRDPFLDPGEVEEPEGDDEA